MTEPCFAIIVFCMSGLKGIPRLKRIEVHILSAGIFSLIEDFPFYIEWKRQI